MATTLKNLPEIENLSERLRWARERSGKGSVALSLEAGLSHGTVSRLEARPDAELEAKTAFKIAKLVNVDPQWLVCGHADPLTLGSSRRGRKKEAPKVRKAGG